MIQTSTLVKKAALSLDQADHVQELLASRDAYAAFLKVVRFEVTSMESAVISMPSSEGAEALFHAKVKAEGARKLLTILEGLPTKKVK